MSAALTGDKQRSTNRDPSEGDQQVLASHGIFSG